MSMGQTYIATAVHTGMARISIGYWQYWLLIPSHKMLVRPAVEVLVQVFKHKCI